MSFTSQQSRNAYKKLPSEIQDLIMSLDTTELIETLLKEFGLDEDQANLADSEILYSLYCLQSLDEAIQNIAKLSNKNVAELENLKETIQKEIFDKYTIDVADFIKTNQAEVPAPATNPEVASEIHPVRSREPEVPAEVLPAIRTSNGIHPMIEEGEVVHEVPHVEFESKPTPTINIPDKPLTQPVTTPPPPTPPKPSGYAPGQDPYREPLA